MNYYNKHYIRIDTNKYIIKGFSDAFETPLDTDICINQEGERHFELSGQVNPPLIDLSGSHLYKYVDGSISENTEEERTAEIKRTKLPTWKNNKVAESKTKLDEFLANNPYLFTDNKYYSVTKDKQNLLANAISLYQMKVQSGETDPIIMWNAKGQQCTEWTIDNMILLALSISTYVEPLITKQQEIEIKINSCTTKTELDSIVIDYQVTM